MFKKGRSPESALDGGIDVNSVSSVMENIVFSEQQKLEDLNKLIKKLEEMETIKAAEIQNLHEEKGRLEELKVKTQQMLHAAIEKKEEEKNQAIATAKQQLETSFDSRRSELESSHKQKQSTLENSFHQKQLELENSFEQKQAELESSFAMKQKTMEQQLTSRFELELEAAKDEFYATERVRIELECQKRYEADLEKQYNYIASEFNNLISQLGGFKSTIDSSFGSSVGIYGDTGEETAVRPDANCTADLSAEKIAEEQKTIKEAAMEFSVKSSELQVTKEAFKNPGTTDFDAVVNDNDIKAAIANLDLQLDDAKKEIQFDVNPYESIGSEKESNEFSHLQGLLGADFNESEENIGDSLDDIVAAEEARGEVKLDNLIDFDEIQYRYESGETKEKAVKASTEQMTAAHEASMGPAQQPIQPDRSSEDGVADSYKDLVRLQEERMEKLMKMMQE